MSIKLIIGLRNPGSTYSKTRHNAGEWFVDRLANKYNLTFKTEKKLNSEIAILRIHNESYKILLPLTFMNQSGRAVRSASDFYDIKPEEILVIHDDLDLPSGKIKLKSGGGHGGHNGLRDIIQHLGSNEFNRIRIGINHPGDRQLVLNYVLGKATKDEREQINEAIDRVIDLLPDILSGQIAQAMNILHS